MDKNASDNQTLPMPLTRDAVMRRRYEAISAGVIVFDPVGIMIYANRQAEAILGLSWAEMAGSCCVDPHWKSFDADGNALEPANFPNFLSAASGKPVHNRVIGLRRCPEQSLRWLLVNASPVVDPQTQAVQEVIITLNDITELRRTEEALRDSERRLVFALQSIHAGEWELNLQDRSVRFSSRCANIFLGEAATIPLQSCYDRVLEYVVAEDREHVRQVITAAIRERNAFDVEGRIRRADGMERWIRVSGRPCANGDEVTALVGVTIDITEHKLAEIAKHQSMVRSHEALVNEIVENLDLLYCFVGSDLKYKAFNRRQADFIKMLHGTENIREENYLSFITSDSDRRIQRMVQKKKSLRRKKIRMKKKKGPLILICVLVLLLILYFVLSTWNKKQDSKEEETVKVTDLKTSEITGVKYDLGTGEMNFEKDGDTWYYTADKDFPLRQSYPKTVADAMGQLSADRELEDADALEEYGLDHPTYTVTLTDEDGTVTTIKVGNATGNDYYATVDDTEKVYTIPATSLDDIQTELDQIAQLDTYPSIGSGNLKKEVITQNGETTTYDSENEDQAEDVAAVAGGLGAVKLSEAADYSVDDADLAGYGLDATSRITVEVTYTSDDEDQTMTLYIGGENGSGDRYVMINDSRIVYLISDEICKNILNQ